MSAAFHDEPTIDALNRIGLDYASVGNHEFDEGAGELLRIQNGGCHPEDGCSDRRSVRRARTGSTCRRTPSSTETGDTLLPPYAITKVAGHQGRLHRHDARGHARRRDADRRRRPRLRRRGGDANQLRRASCSAQGVRGDRRAAARGWQQTGATDVDGCNGLTGAITAIVPQIDAAIDVVITGHTHQAYNCREIDGTFVPSTSTSDGRLVTSAASVGRWSPTST